MKRFKRILIAVVGGSVLVVGIALIVLPGPAFLAIPLDLAILAAEFAWATRWLRSARAVLPRQDRSRSPARGKKLAIQSARRSLEFLLRQVRRTLTRRRIPMHSRS